ncbi:ABC transporter ATP-binding protein [bacterium]|nr:ABC transporter ATP-binding protein [bacterium]
MDTQYAIRTENLTKVFKGELGQKDVTALQGLELSVSQGQVFAFIGPNGAGKTTTIKLLTRLLFPTSGNIWLLDRENRDPEAMRKIGYLPEQPGIYGYLTGKEFLDYIGRIFKIPPSDRHKKIDELLQLTGLAASGDTLVRNYSRGMVQRLGLAQALINDPELLILDEPMANLDPVGRKDFRDTILDLKNQGKTIFFSSHILSDAEMIADQVGVLNRGRMVSSGSLDELLSLQSSEVEISFRLPAGTINDITLPAEHQILSSGRVRVTVEHKEINEFLNRIDEWKGTLISVVPGSRTLEAFFLDEIGR